MSILIPTGRLILIERYFTNHPRAVGETYIEHLQTASGFGLAMVVAGLACLVHALVPGLFVKTGSAAIKALHDQMIVNRNRSHTTPAHDEHSAVPAE
jgi:hypothetical protein